MAYFILLLFIVILTKAFAGTWRKTLLLPWIVLLTPTLIGAGLSQFNLMPSIISPWSDRNHIVVLVGIAAILLGSFSMRDMKGEFHVREINITWNEKSVILVLFFITFIAFSANVTEFFIAKQIPLLSSDPDRARGEVAKYGYIHIFSVLPVHIIPLCILIMASKTGNYQRMTKSIITVVLIINVGLLMMWFSRGLLFFPIMTSIVTVYIFNKKFFKLRTIAMVFLLLLAIIVGIKYYRGVVKYGERFGAQQSKLFSIQAASPFVQPLMTAWLSTSISFEILNQYVQYVPRSTSYSYGRIFAGILFSFIPGKEYTERDFQNVIINKTKEEATLTSTFFGIPYIEFGFVGVIAISYLVGLLYKTIWRRMRKNGSPIVVLLYSYLVAIAALMPYSFIYVRVSFFWFILTSVICVYLCQSKIRRFSIYHKKGTIRFSP